MDKYEYTELLKELQNKLSNIKSILKPDEIVKKLEKIKTIEQDPEFWNDQTRAKKLSKNKNSLLSKLKKFDTTSTILNDAKELYDLSNSENDDESLEVLYEEAQQLKKSVFDTEIQVMLSADEDKLDAIVSIHPGAGGTESCDWANMLYRMYLRWADIRGFKIELLDYQAGDETGIKDVSFIISGLNAYGYMKVENGIHRLVRISPFDSNAKRHTSFSSVMVSPQVDDDIDIVIEDKDIRIDTYRASGAGGQHVNKTESAVRLTHIATGVVVQCQNDRSQHKNKASAMKMLKSRLYEIELEKQKALKDGTPKNEIGWGHQIRSYVLQPYQQVKDNRTNIGYSNIDAILDGDLDKLMEDVLIALNR
ncbi:MAG: peptide chain release factor 2 [Epsilonproteobacteria bacterium]|nr:MAG: peptide chain release factor 2 [Campylobacterota bacterium]